MGVDATDVVVRDTHRPGGLGIGFGLEIDGVCPVHGVELGSLQGRLELLPTSGPWSYRVRRTVVRLSEGDEKVIRELLEPILRPVGEVLVELDRDPAGLKWPELWARVTLVIPEVPDDLEKNDSGTKRGETDVRFYLTNLDKSGWIITGAGPMRITAAGREALHRYEDPLSLDAAAAAGYKRWDELREPEPLASKPNLAGGILPTAATELVVLNAARLILERGLREGGSAFAPGRPAWSAANVAALRAAFVDHIDTGKDSFVTKLSRQLSESPDDVVLLAAEMLSLILLPLADWGRDTKRKRVKEVLLLMNEPVHILPDVSAAMDYGVFNGSLGFTTLLWRALSTVIEVAAAWWKLDEAGREDAWQDPWSWRSLVEAASGDTTASARAELLYLLHPAAFPQADVPGARRAWLVRGSSVRGVDMIPAWLEEGFVSLAASQLRQLEMPPEPADIRSAVDEGYAQVPYLKREEKIREVRALLLAMKPDDLVMTTSGGVIHVGRIAGEPEQVASEGGRSNLRRLVEWADVSAAFEELPAELSALLKSGGDVTDLTDAIDLVANLLPPIDIVDPPKPPPPPTILDLRHLTDEEADALLVGKEWLDELVDLLNLRRQAILYGPPGTGKTYLALKTAEAIAQPENVRMVQFHPSYSYEDFFEGYRPRRGEGGVVGFELKAGPFRRIVEDAREHPDQPYVLIIDEINRANLAKVFGELYFLLEYRDNAIELLNSEEDSKPFSLPKNVYIIGTMNTADRSIALVDAAMRRRFALLSLHPDDAHVHGMLRAWLERRGLDTRPADLLDELNSRIPDRDFAVGPAYLMKPGEVDSEAGLERIWRTSILPQLEELHYGDSVDVVKRYGLAALRDALPQKEQDASPGGAAAGT